MLGGGAQMQLGKRPAFNAGMRRPQRTHAFVDMQGVARQLLCVRKGVPAVAVDGLIVICPDALSYGRWLPLVARATVSGVLW
jgi:hypothetical protein